MIIIRWFRRNSVSSARGFLVSAKIFLINPRGEVLILRRSVWRKIPGEEYHPERGHQLDLPGGIVRDEIAGETATAGLLREVREETGIQLDSLAPQLFFATMLDNVERGRSWTLLFYYAKLNDTPEVELSWEHEEFSWRDLDAAIDFPDDNSGEREALVYLRTHREMIE
jgi:8-oxo-dGTP pyrophosphatase MutT (NUDIX family)